MKTTTKISPIRRNGRVLKFALEADHLNLQGQVNHIEDRLRTLDGDVSAFHEKVLYMEETYKIAAFFARIYLSVREIPAKIKSFFTQIVGRNV